MLSQRGHRAQCLQKTALVEVMLQLGQRPSCVTYRSVPAAATVPVLVVLVVVVVLVAVPLPLPFPPLRPVVVL